MDISFLGFNLSLSGVISLNDLLDQACLRSGDTVKSNAGKNVHLYLNGSHSDSYYRGLVLTLKEQKNMLLCQMGSGKDSDLMIKKEPFKIDMKLMDANFFVINKKNGIGLYQHYSGACGSGTVFAYLGKHYNELKENLINTEILSQCNVIESSDSSPREKEKLKRDLRKRVKEKYKGSFKYELMSRQDDFSEELSSMLAIKVLDLGFSEPTVIEDEFLPLQDAIKMQRRKFTFTKSAGDGFVGVVKSVVDKVKPDSGRAVGIDCFGVEKIISMRKKVCTYHTLSFDDFFRNVSSIKASDFYHSDVFIQLEKVCASNPSIFDAEVG